MPWGDLIPRRTSRPKQTSHPHGLGGRFLKQNKRVVGQRWTTVTIDHHFSECDLGICHAGVGCSLERLIAIRAAQKPEQTNCYSARTCRV
jgi:hypothetical protein